MTPQMWLTLGCTLATIGVTVVTGLMARSKMQGVIETSVKNLKEQVDKHEQKFEKYDEEIDQLKKDQATQGREIAAFAGSPRAKAAHIHG